MEIFYYFECEFPSVYLVNGVFFESVSALKSEAADSLYITALPLDAVYLPYTVRIGGGEIYANSALARLYRLQSDRYYVRFSPRFNYVYSPVSHSRESSDGGMMLRLFRALKKGDTTQARKLLSPELSASVDDNSLLKFFDGYMDIVENNGFVPLADCCFLIPNDNSIATVFKVQYRDGLIDNIVTE